MPFGISTGVALARDVNGDGISDLVLFRNGVWYASTHQDNVVDATFYFGTAGDQPLLGDIDGDAERAEEAHEVVGRRRACCRRR